MLPRIITRGDHEAARLLAREGIRQLNILKNLMSFGNLKQDVRRVRFTNGSEIICRSIFGIDDVQIYVPEEVSKKKIENKLYVYVTISDYVVIWDLETGEVAEDVTDNDGHFIKFPCHKDELTNWMATVENKPTEQNRMDAGNESRVKSGADDGIGLEQTPSFTHLIGETKDYLTCPDGEIVAAEDIEGPSGQFNPAMPDLCGDGATKPANEDGTCPVVSVCKNAYVCGKWPVCSSCSKGGTDCTCFWMEGINWDKPTDTQGNIYENSWSKTYIGEWIRGLTWECKTSFFRFHPDCGNGTVCGNKWLCDYYPSWGNDKYVRVSVNRPYRGGYDSKDNALEYLEKWRWRSEKVYLLPPENGKVGLTGLTWEMFTCSLTRMFSDAQYCDSSFGYTDWKYPSINLKCENIVWSYVMSYKTALGDLLIDLIPVRTLRDIFEDLNTYQPLREKLRNFDTSTWRPKKFDPNDNDIFLSNKFADAFIEEHIARNGLTKEIADHLRACSNVGDPTEEFRFFTPSPKFPYASCKRAIFYGAGLDPKGYGQLGIRYNKNLGERDKDDRLGISWCESPDKKDWYKIKLFFYTGRVKSAWLTHDYPIGSADGSNYILIQQDYFFCVDGEYKEDYVEKRFSSVQATIELDHPEKFKKKNTTVPGKPEWVKRYRRPKDYSNLGEFPGRLSGYPEDSDGCYPFDGTYDIYTLGEAVENLINECYKEGSDDPLLVYYLRRKTS